jgi:integrase
MTSLHRAVDEYLTLRRTLGHKLEREGRELPRFATFLAARGSDHITTTLALQWATQPVVATPGYLAARLRMVRRFALHLSARDARTEVPAPELLSHRTQRATPYIYAAADVSRLLAATATLQSPVMGTTYRTLLGVLACTGMRVGEALALDDTDFDWRGRLLLVRHSKFGKSRYVPLHETAVARLQAYRGLRDRAVPARSPSFFLEHHGTRLVYANVAMTFLRLVRRAGLAHAQPRRPRIHDFRHTFAVQTLVRWYRAGVDVPAWLPRLSTYLGHVSPSSTYWYLTATPALMAYAEARRERTLRGQP